MLVVWQVVNDFVDSHNRHPLSGFISPSTSVSLFTRRMPFHLLAALLQLLLILSFVFLSESFASANEHVWLRPQLVDQAGRECICVYGGEWILLVKLVHRQAINPDSLSIFLFCLF